MSISALIHTKNSEKTIVSALDSVKWADEIVIVDMHSDDTTIEICKKYTDKIFYFEDVGYVEPARNFGISKTSGDWILILDADEEIPATLAEKLQEVADLSADAWELPRKNILFDHWIKSAGWWPDYNVRFFKKGSVNWPKEVHGRPMVTGELKQLPPEEKYAILHHNYSSVSEFIDRMNKYTTITVSEDRKTKDSALAGFFGEFLGRFLAKKGYEDGVAGMHASLLQSFYEAVVRIKQWEALKAPNTPIDVSSELSQLLSQVAYWRADYMVSKSKGLHNLYWRIRRKLKK